MYEYRHLNTKTQDNTGHEHRQLICMEHACAAQLEDEAAGTSLGCNQSSKGPLKARLNNSAFASSVTGIHPFQDFMQGQN